MVFLLLVHHFNSATRRASISNPYFIIATSWQHVFTAFFMPCFFLISGYCSNFESDCSEFLKKVFRQLLLPWFIFELLHATFWAIYDSDFTLHYYRSFLLKEPCTTLWFLNALAFSKVMLYVLKRTIRHDYAVLAVLFVVLILSIIINQFDIGHNYLTIRESMASCFFVGLGVFLKSRQSLLHQLMKYSPYAYIPLISVMMLSVWPIPSFTAGLRVSISQIPVFLILSLSGSLSLLLLCKKMDNNSALEYLGRNSLTIYCNHFCPLYALLVFFYTHIGSTSLSQFLLFFLAVYVSLLLVCIFLVEAFNLKPLRWIIGR